MQRLDKPFPGTSIRGALMVTSQKSTQLSDANQNKDGAGEGTRTPASTKPTGYLAVLFWLPICMISNLVLTREL